MCYMPLEDNFVVPDPYRIYDTPVIRREDIPANALIVIPEIWPQLIAQFSQPCAFWWLSVDSFYSWSGDTDAMRGAAVHLAQSEYARRHLSEVFGIKSLMLTDFINVGFVEPVGMVKQPRVAVNPSKGRALLAEFRESFPYIDVIELAGMSREQVKAELAASAIYIDFGHHPGRDRLPREAALSGVVVFTTKFGSAANHVDMPLDDWYKFDSVSELGEKIRLVFHDFNSHVAAQKNYQDVVRSQRAVFEHEVARLLYYAEIRELLGSNFY